MDHDPDIPSPGERKYRAVPGYFNQMAVCSICDRDATETRMSFYCIDCIEDQPFRCDECRNSESRPGCNRDGFRKCLS